MRDYDMEVIGNKVAVVLRRMCCFWGTILDNLRWGKADATEDECREVCGLACADEFIDRMPDGYNTWIEQGGSNVSGGQKQRLCIARAPAQEPKVLILMIPRAQLTLQLMRRSGRHLQPRYRTPPRSSYPREYQVCRMPTGS